MACGNKKLENTKLGNAGITLSKFKVVRILYSTLNLQFGSIYPKAARYAIGF